jgi:hypothetical protein
MADRVLAGEERFSRLICLFGAFNFTDFEPTPDWWARAVVRKGIDPESRVRERVGLCREVFGTPSRPVSLDPRWQTPTVLAIARGIYDDRAFDRLLVLADALLDAGCENPEILAHCRGDGPHVRGCWVVDLVLGKE